MGKAPVTHREMPVRVRPVPHSTIMVKLCAFKVIHRPVREDRTAIYRKYSKKNYISMMTEKDRRLISEAEAVPWSEWERITPLEEQAQTKEGRDAIRRIQIRKNHEEEFYCCGSN